MAPLSLSDSQFQIKLQNECRHGWNDGRMDNRNNRVSDYLSFVEDKGLVDDILFKYKLYSFLEVQYNQNFIRWIYTSNQQTTSELDQLFRHPIIP